MFIDTPTEASVTMALNFVVVSIGFTVRNEGTRGWIPCQIKGSTSMTLTTGYIH